MLKDIIGHEDIIKNLRLLKNNPPKIMIFDGPKGVGRKHTAYNFIDEIHNGYLQGKIFNHPDIYLFKPDTKIFKIDLVHKILKETRTTPFELGNKYFILDNAHLMSREAANSCLKIFEDCPNNCLFILIADTKEGLLDTILSRSVSISFFPNNNLKSYFPKLDDLEIKLMRGCIGNLSLAQDKQTKNLYVKIGDFVSKFDRCSYSDIIEWVFSVRDIEFNLIMDLIHIYCLDALHDKKNLNLIYIKNILVKIIILKKDVEIITNHHMYLKSMLFKVKYELDNLN